MFAVTIHDGGRVALGTMDIVFQVSGDYLSGALLAALGDDIGPIVLGDEPNQLVLPIALRVSAVRVADVAASTQMRVVIVVAAVASDMGALGPMVSPFEEGDTIEAVYDLLPEIGEDRRSLVVRPTFRGLESADVRQNILDSIETFFDPSTPPIELAFGDLLPDDITVAAVASSPVAGRPDALLVGLALAGTGSPGEASTFRATVADLLSGGDWAFELGAEAVQRLVYRRAIGAIGDLVANLGGILSRVDLESLSINLSGAGALTFSGKVMLYDVFLGGDAAICFTGLGSVSLDRRRDPARVVLDATLKHIKPCRGTDPWVDPFVPDMDVDYSTSTSLDVPIPENGALGALRITGLTTSSSGIRLLGDGSASPPSPAVAGYLPSTVRVIRRCAGPTPSRSV